MSIIFSSQISAQPRQKAQTESEIKIPSDPRFCSMLGSVYQVAAMIRDSGNSPELALSQASSIPDVPEQIKKNVINQVFFDPGFINAGGSALRMQVMSYCINGFKPKYEPLE